MANTTTYYSIKEIMDSFGIPEWIWSPIAQLESNFNPTARGITDKEYSVGVFQINLMAHPEYSKYNLDDPKQNAYAIADLWQKRGVIEKALALPQEMQAAYVWRYGSRPAWSDALNDRVTNLSKEVIGNITRDTDSSYFDDDFMRRFRTLFPEDATNIFGPGPAPAPGAGYVPEVTLNLTGIIVRGFAYGLIFILIFISLLQVVPAPVPVVGDLKKAVKNFAE